MFYTKEILLHGKSIRYTLAFTVLSLLGIGDLDALRTHANEEPHSDDSDEELSFH